MHNVDVHSDEQELVYYEEAQNHFPSAARKMVSRERVLERRESLGFFLGGVAAIESFVLLFLAGDFVLGGTAIVLASASAHMGKWAMDELIYLRGSNNLGHEEERSQPIPTILFPEIK